MIARKLIKVASERDVAVVREAGRKLAKAVGFEGAELTLIGTAISEIARNIFTYAREGAIEISTIEDGTQSGIEVIARDEGPGEGTMVTTRKWLRPETS